MKIELSQEQYMTLVKLLHLANWPLGLTDADQDLSSKAEELEQYIFSLSENFRCADQIYFDREADCFQLTDSLREKVESIIDEYEEDIFWEQLTHKLATNDLKREMNRETSLEEKINRLFQLKERYEKYFLKNGLDNLNIF